MTFDANADFVSLKTATASKGKGKGKASDAPEGKTKSRIPKSIYRRRTAEKKQRMKARVQRRKIAREEYKRLSALAGLDGLPARKSKKNRYDVDALDELYRKAQNNPQFGGLKDEMTIDEMKQCLLTGSEKRALKREERAKRGEERKAKKDKKLAQKGEQDDDSDSDDSSDEEEENELGFVIDTEGAK